MQYVGDSEGPSNVWCCGQFTTFYSECWNENLEKETTNPVEKYTIYTFWSKSGQLASAYDSIQLKWTIPTLTRYGGSVVQKAGTISLNKAMACHWPNLKAVPCTGLIMPLTTLPIKIWFIWVYSVIQTVVIWSCYFSPVLCLYTISSTM